MTRLFNLLVLCLLFVLALTLIGCQAPRGGTAVDTIGGQAQGNLTDAHADLLAAKPHADAVGKAYIDSADTSLLAGAKKLVATITAADADHAERIKAETAMTACVNSVGHRVQVWVTRIFWWTVTIIGILFAIHILCGLAAIAIMIFAPTLVGVASILSKIAKIINPLGWLSWAVTHFQNRQKLKAATDSVNLLSQ